jgi:integrase
MNENYKNEIEKIVGNIVGEKFDLLVKALTGEKKSDYTLFSWLDVWYKEYKENHNPPLTVNSLYQIRNCIEKHIKPNIDNKMLHLLTPLDCQKGINKILSTRMAVYAFDTLNDSLRQAYINGEIKENPLEKVKKPKHQCESVLPLTKIQEYEFIRSIRDNRLENLYLFYLASGCRKLEAVTIKWDYIDYGKNQLFIDSTKTPCSKRYIPLFDDIKTILKRISKKSEYIFPYEDYTIKNNWRWLRLKHPEINFGIHALRHTFATRHYENGVSDKVIQKWLGHSKVSTTQNIYIDVLDEFEKAEFEKANNARKLIKNKR